MNTNNESLRPQTGVKYGVKGAEKPPMDKGNKSYLLKRSSSQISLIDERFHDNERRISSHFILIPSSNTCSNGNSFTKPAPLSSFPEQRARSRSFPRPTTSFVFINRDTGRNGPEPIERKQTNANTKLLPTKDPIQPFRRASCVNLQAHRRVSLEGPPRRWKRKVSRGEIFGRRYSRGFRGVVTSGNEGEDEEEGQARRKRAFERFRRAGQIVRIFSSLYLRIRRFAEHDKSGRYDLYYMRDTLPGNEHQPTLVQDNAITFNKRFFSRDKTLYFPLWARWTCAKAPENRNESEINKLVTLLRGMKSFSKFSREAQQNLCRTMTYACYERRRLIVRQGHPGFCFYFIVSGSVSVTVTRKDYKTGIYITNTVDVLEKSDAFGEIALFSEEAKRTASIICREQVEVVLVNRETILEHCPDVFQQESLEKMRVLRSHPLFHGWTEDSLRSLGFRSHIREFSYGKLVDVNSTTSESIYFIIKGKLEMLRGVDLKAFQVSDVTVALFEDCPLPRIITALPRKGANKCFINVGSLQDKDAWDLMTLDPRQAPGPGNILVSAGVRLLKVPKRNVVDLSPRDHLESFKENYCPRHRCLTDEEVCRAYLTAQSWLSYRKKVVRNVIDYKAQRYITHVSSTAKGSSGWTAWPGKQT